MSDYITQEANEEVVDVQWFPGHMTKAKRTIQKNLSLVDAVVEVLDARAPLSSANPDLSKIIDGKPRLILLNKIDLADHRITKKWIDYFKKMDIDDLLVDCKSGVGLNKVVLKIKDILKSQIERRAKKGMLGTSIRAMVVGIPNVGKSSFINKMAKKKKAKVEDRPGVTRGKQWIDAGNGFEFLDMPGVLWPKFDDKAIGEKLAFLGTIKDHILDIELLAARLLKFLCLNLDYKQKVFQRYRITDLEINELKLKKDYKKLDMNLDMNLNGHIAQVANEKDIRKISNKISDDDLFYYCDLVELVGKKRGMIVSGGEVDTERTAAVILDEFRGGKLGAISLDII